MLKNILVHVDSGSRMTARVAVAKSLAQRSGARLVGVFAQRAYAEQVGLIVNWPSPEYVEAVGTARAKFEQAVRDLPATGWQDINRGSESEILKQVVTYARYGDLMVFGQMDSELELTAPPRLAEEVATASGCPILVMPHRGDFPDVGYRPLIVWNDSREAARALHDSLALMDKGTQATLLVLDKTNEEARRSSLEVERYLVCHGIDTRTEVHTEGRTGMWESILNRAAETGADLLVIGAHRQIGFPYVRCEVVLEEATIPVFMSA